MSQLANTSATSLNFIGFEDVKGQGLPELIYNQVFIEPNQSYTAGVGQLAAAGFVPGTQSYLKRRQAVWSQTSVGKQLASEGFVFEAPMTAKQQIAKFQSGGAPPEPAGGHESAYTHADNRVARGVTPKSDQAGPLRKRKKVTPFCNS